MGDRSVSTPWLAICVVEREDILLYRIVEEEAEPLCQESADKIVKIEDIHTLSWWGESRGSLFALRFRS